MAVDISAVLSSLPALSSSYDRRFAKSVTLRWRGTTELDIHRTLAAGPYGFLRHPLYAGTLLIVSGLILAAGFGLARFALPVGLAHFFFYYLPYKERSESSRLEARHGAAFADYRGAVPAILPRLSGWRGGASGAGSI